MYANLGPGHEAELDPPSPNGVDVLYSHEYVAERMRERNLYGYCGNSPLTFTDPKGLLRQCPANSRADNDGGARTVACSTPWTADGWFPDLQQYGCYCGKEPSPSRKTVPPPTDCVDQCCCIHDNEYELIESGQQGMTTEQADKNLVVCVKACTEACKCSRKPCRVAARKIAAYFDDR